MEIISAFLKLGPSVMMPIVFFILALIFGVKPGQAFKAGMLVGIGFEGIGLVIGLLLGSLGPATEAMVQRFGLNLRVLDVGWPVGAQIGWRSPLVPLVVFGGLGINVVLLLVRFTKTVNIDIFNYWLILLPATIVYANTGSVALGCSAAFALLIVALFIADRTAPLIQKSFNLPGVSFAHSTTAMYAPLGWIVNAIIERIPGLRAIDANPEAINKRFGILGEPLTLGIILGVGLGLLAGWDVGEVFNLGIKMAAIMVLLPVMIGVLVQGLVIVRDAAEVSLKKHFPNREFYIGLDTALLIGEPAVLATGLLMIPMALLLAMVLPGNRVLPFVDLASLLFFLPMAAPYCKNNIFRLLCTAALVMVVTLYTAGDLAPGYTKAAAMTGVSLPGEAGDREVVNLVAPHTTPQGWAIVKLLSALK